MIHKTIPDAPPPHEAHARLARRYATTFVLESKEGPEKMARYSFVGFDPAGTITYHQDRLQVTGALPAPSRDQRPLTYLRRILDFYRVFDHETPFVGGLVGSFGYDFVRDIEPVLENQAPEPWPRFVLGLYLDGLVYDHVAGTATYVSRGEDRSQLLAAALAKRPSAPRLRVGAVRAHVDEATFCAQVADAQEQIAAGEAFQIVLSRAYHADHDGTLTDLYDWLREQVHVPYLYHLRFQEGSRELVGASPEMLVRVRDGTVDTFPIAGTRPMTGDAEVDAAAADDLLADAKETAEHAMLVDLSRNDLGRVCVMGSVRVASYQEIQRFRNVQHLVSQVQGDLDPAKDALDALAAAFPAGTVSGAPKIRAMEHIDRIERHPDNPRGPYAGAVVYASFNGDLDSAIAIRSLSAQDGSVTVQAGAGITIQSDPSSEYQETHHKARTLLDALVHFGGEMRP